MLGEWKLPRVQETFSCKTTFFIIDQLIAENPSHQNKPLTFLKYSNPQIKSVADQDCLAPYVGADFIEYQWRRCRTMIGEKPQRPDCILCVFKAYSASKKILVYHIINRAL